MRLPGFVARPMFSVLYGLARRSVAVVPIRRVVRPVSAECQNAFDDLLVASLERDGGGLITYRLPYPKSEFLNYLCDWKGFVAHGSPLADLTRLEPVRLGSDTNEFGNRQQVFGSPDAMWAMWFAILDKSRVSRTDNGCVRVGRGSGRAKYCHFELPREQRGVYPFVAGMMYLARPESYPNRRGQGVLKWFDAEIEEWGSTGPVAPILRVAVKPEEFPYLDRVGYRL